MEVVANKSGSRLNLSVMATPPGSQRPLERKDTVNSQRERRWNAGSSSRSATGRRESVAGSSLLSLKAYYRKLRTFKGTVKALINLRRVPTLVNTSTRTGSLISAVTAAAAAPQLDQTAEEGEAPKAADAVAKLADDEQTLQTVQTQVQQLVDNGHVVTELGSDDVTYRMQGNLDHYTEENLRRRVKLQQHPHMIALTQRLWLAASHEQEEHLCFGEYEAYMLRLHRLILPEFDLAQSKELIKDDWTRDTDGSDHLDYRYFHFSMFELVDLWTDTVEVEDYISLLYCIMHCLTFEWNDRHLLKDLEDINPVDILEASKDITKEEIERDLSREVNGDLAQLYRDRVSDTMAQMEACADDPALHGGGSRVTTIDEDSTDGSERSGNSKAKQSTASTSSTGETDPTKVSGAGSTAASPRKGTGVAASGSGSTTNRQPVTRVKSSPSKSAMERRQSKESGARGTQSPANLQPGSTGSDSNAQATGDGADRNGTDPSQHSNDIVVSGSKNGTDPRDQETIVGSSQRGHDSHAVLDAAGRATASHGIQQDDGDDGSRSLSIGDARGARPSLSPRKSRLSHGSFSSTAHDGAAGGAMDVYGRGHGAGSRTNSSNHSYNGGRFIPGNQYTMGGGDESGGPFSITSLGSGGQYINMVSRASFMRTRSSSNAAMSRGDHPSTVDGGGVQGLGLQSGHSNNSGATGGSTLPATSSETDDTIGSLDSIGSISYRRPTTSSPRSPSYLRLNNAKENTQQPLDRLEGVGASTPRYSVSPSQPTHSSTQLGVSAKDNEARPGALVLTGEQRAPPPGLYGHRSTTGNLSPRAQSARYQPQQSTNGNYTMSTGFRAVGSGSGPGIAAQLTGQSVSQGADPLSFAQSTHSPSYRTAMSLTSRATMALPARQGGVSSDYLQTRAIHEASIKIGRPLQRPSRVQQQRISQSLTQELAVMSFTTTAPAKPVTTTPRGRQTMVHPQKQDMRSFGGSIVGSAPLSFEATRQPATRQSLVTPGRFQSSWKQGATVDPALGIGVGLSAASARLEVPGSPRKSKVN